MQHITFHSRLEWPDRSGRAKASDNSGNSDHSSQPDHGFSIQGNPPSTFAACLEELHSEHGADIFLSRVQGRLRIVAGLARDRELVLTHNTTPADISRFCFQDDCPTYGWMGYEYGMLLRSVPPRLFGEFPLGQFRKYKAYLVHEEDYNGTINVFGKDRNLLESIRERIQSASSRSDNAVRQQSTEGSGWSETTDHTAPLPCPGTIHSSVLVSNLHQTLCRSDYIKNVKTVLDRIADGHTYQLNLSTRFEGVWNGAHPLRTLLSLFDRHPAAHYAYLQVDRDRHILSTSPERFLKVANGHLLSQPIKGTLRLQQHGTPTRAEVAALCQSPKEQAELSMIVDLVRNDISASCEYGSVRVSGHRSIFHVDDLLQMYANVHGVLRSDRNVIDLLCEAFPGGSITGCPKKRSMEIIRELEPHPREFYCGATVLVHGPRDMDSAITIRTAGLDTRRQHFMVHAGSGIVMDSVPELEYKETTAKAGKFLQLFGEQA